MSSPCWNDARASDMPAIPSRTAGSLSLSQTAVPMTCRETTTSSILRSPGLETNLDFRRS